MPFVLPETMLPGVLVIILPSQTVLHKISEIYKHLFPLSE